MRAKSRAILLHVTVLLSMVSVGGAAGAGETAAGSREGLELFESRIRPLLQGNCYRCHSGRLSKPKGGFVLDSREGLRRGGGRGPAIVPGEPARSLLLEAVRYGNPELKMPPKGKLAEEDIAALARWVELGAADPRAPGTEAPGGSGRGAAGAAAARSGVPDAASVEARRRSHWAFRAPARPPLPEVKRADWVRNPLDRFVLARLEAEGLSPSPEADRTTLLRRLSLDLTGLPPALADVEAFLADGGAGACEKQVERLLASPHYGERWARHWLDAARYADSDGYEKDKLRTVWFYRDWVIEALNRDLPYDRFIVEQIAGDLLPDAGQDQRVATGFLRNSMINEEGGIDPEQFRMEAMFDRMDAIGKSILGLTIQCAQCHNHKFDPLTQDEYYRMFAFLNDCHEANITVYTPQEERKRAEVFRRIREIEADLRHRHPDWRERMARWEEERRANQPEWTVVRPEVEEISNGGQKYLPQPDGSFLAQGYAPTKHRVKMTVRAELEGITAFRLELLNDPNLPRGGPGRSILGTGALTELEVEAAPASDPGKASKVKLVRATADLNAPEKPLDPIYDDRSGKRRVTGGVSFAIDGDALTAWGTDAGPGRRNEERKAVFVAEAPLSHAGGSVLTFYLRQDHGGWNSDDNQNHNLGRLRLSVTCAPQAEADPVPRRLREVLALPREARSPAQEEALFGHFRTSVPEWKEANEAIEALWREHPEGSTQLVLLSREQPRSTHLLKRGDFLKPERAVQPGTPAFLHPLAEGAPPGRLGLARWLADRASPTTARTLVNRVWQAYFGQGLVTSSEDLGTQSEPPSHPELLDWLAVEFMDRGWSLKELHRLITGSATYRQSSRVPAELQSRDPYNRLLARGPRLRVEAETVRDIALAASGLLNRQVGGRSIYPPLPEFMLLPPVSYGPKVWYEEKGPQRYRRGLYIFRYRSLPYPVLQNFDAPPGETSCVRRMRSNTPLQALTTLNESVFFECARALALRALAEGGGSDAERLSYAFRLCLARSPEAEEAEELLRFLESQRRRIAEGSLDAGALAGPAFEGRPPAGEETLAGAAAWTSLARVLLNLDETITKE